MIIGEQAKILDAEFFAVEMSRAMRSVVLIGIEGQAGGRASGWVLTPQLVIAPDYALNPDASEPLVVRGVAGGKVSWEERVEGPQERLGAGRFSPPTSQRPLALALLRLKNPKRLPRLNFATAIPAPGSFVSLLSFPGGRKLCLSPGTLTEMGEPAISYHADSEGGSGGGPVFDETWRVIAMHMLSDRTLTANQGVTMTAMLEMLRESRYWQEIASFHRLADVSAASGKSGADEEKVAPDAIAVPGAVVRAAVVTSFPASRLSAIDKATLRPLVIDPDDKRWTLQPSERVKVLRAAGVATLRQFAPSRPREAGDRVIRRILDGPPYDLALVEEEALPWWIQAAGWFAGVMEGLPSTEQVARELERRRVRSRLEAIAGKDFQGRETELAELGKWFKQEPPVPFSLTGIGGMGKSSLVARFASSLPASTLLLWLDFDRADLAPEDAVSVLTALGAQAAVQLDGFTAPPVKAETWGDDAAELGRALAVRSLPEPPLLVLDSFEVAQYGDRYQELWKTLDLVSEQLPALRVIVSGRVPVTNLELCGRAAQSRHLTGLSETDAQRWLARHGIKRADIVKRVWELPPRGLPLNLHLAFHLVEAGGKVSDLPKDLPPEIVAGFLYDRILNRVRDRALKPVAQAALVLRRLTVPIAVEVLGPVVKLPAGEPAEWFARLGREASLMEGSTVLTLRHEVRTSALQFLEQAQPKLVREIDHRAEDYYTNLNPQTADLAAELVYHRLRLGDVKGAEKAWRDGCAAHLQYAEENLIGAARQWLQARAGSSAVGDAPLQAWEQEAAERIRSARARGHQRTVQGVFAERGERGSNSPLVFHEAYELRAAGQREEALAHLVSAGDGEGSVFRERAALRGLLLAELGRRYEAEVALRGLNADHWADRPDGQLAERMLLFGGRLRVATDPEAEREMVKRTTSGWGEDSFQGWVAPFDLMLPELSRAFERNSADQVTPVVIPEPGESRDRLVTTVEKLRARMIPNEPPELLAQRQRVNNGRPVTGDTMGGLIPAPLGRALECGWRRWAIATGASSWMLGRMATIGDWSPLAPAVLGAAALFAGLGRLRMQAKSGDLDEIFSERLMVSRARLREAAIGLHLTSPHPLEVLVDLFAGKESAGAS